MPTRRSFLAATAAIVAVDFMSADSASAAFREVSPEHRAAFLENIAAEIAAAQRASDASALPVRS